MPAPANSGSMVMVEEPASTVDWRHLVIDIAAICIVLTVTFLMLVHTMGPLDIAVIAFSMSSYIAVLTMGFIIGATSASRRPRPEAQPLKQYGTWPAAVQPGTEL